MSARPTSEPMIAFAVAALGIALYSTMDAVMKGLSLAIGAYNAIFWRMLIAVPLTGILYLTNRTAWPGGRAIRIHVIRGFITAIMAVAFFWGLARLPLAQAVALTFIAPILALFLAAVLLGERIRRTAIAASVLGFAGVLVILSGHSGGASPGTDVAGAAAVLCSAVFYAYNIVLMRQQAQVAAPLEVTFFQNLTVAFFLGLFAPFVAVVPPRSALPGIAGATVLAIAALFLLAWAYRRAEAQHLAPVEYSALVWAAMFGYFVFDEQVRLSTLAGAALIVAGCLLAARAERVPVSPAEAAL